MGETYNAVFDATKIELQGVSDSVRSAIELVRDEYLRPHVLMRPALSLDGNKWIALYGENLQEGVVGIGDSPAEAMRDFDRAWVTSVRDVLKGGSR